MEKRQVNDRANLIRSKATAYEKRLLGSSIDHNLQINGQREPCSFSCLATMSRRSIEISSEDTRRMLRRNVKQVWLLTIKSGDQSRDLPLRETLITSSRGLRGLVAEGWYRRECLSRGNRNSSTRQLEIAEQHVASPPRGCTRHVRRCTGGGRSLFVHALG